MAYMIGAFAIALLATLALAAFLTPRSWWRRPNVRALAVLAAGTWGIGSLLLWLAPAPAMAASAAASADASATASTTALVATPATAGIAGLAGLTGMGAPHPAVSAGRTFRVFEDLNLRAAGATSARRVAVVPPGAIVTATGAREGDWWEVNARIGGRRVTGWVSSLWLRRSDEAPAAHPH